MENLLTPVGRMVEGSLYNGKSTDMEGRPLTYKTGANQGQPRLNFYFALAIKKGVERHWSETQWGALIYQTASKGFPKGEYSSPKFAWKVLDGDSTEVNIHGVRPCDKEGFPGHWIIKFSNGFAPNIVNRDGTQQILEKDYVNPGDYIQVFATVDSNDSQQQPGVYINPQHVAFAGYGERIATGVPAKDVGFGKDPLPIGASPVPLTSGFNPQPSTPAPQDAPIMPPVPVQPHTAILTPKVMLPKANGIPYEAYIQQGWTDALLVQHGYMQT
jgi:hypothetical protein